VAVAAAALIKTVLQAVQALLLSVTLWRKEK
jgi:hypothetical protein